MSDTRSGAARRLERVGERMREATPPTSLQQHLEGRARLIASVEKMQRPSRARPALVAFAFAAAVAAAVLLVLRVRSGHEGAPIAWHVENGAASAQGYVSIPPTAPSARLVFDDGSDVTLAPGSRGRVAATTSVGAEVVLEQGRARVHVQHRDHTKWLVDAGPFAVRVTGTEFLVAWAADAETLDVWMRSGRVEVTGPVLGDALTLSTGQHLRARLDDRTVQIDGQAEPPETSPETGAINPPPAPTDSTLVVQGVDVSGPTAPVPTGPTWSKLVSSGDFARVVREADAEGVGHALASRPLADLRALGDAARYSGNPALAKRAYSAVRARFPSSGDARTAAFLLGRLAEEQDHSNADAARWYDTYLSEAPGGAFAGDALGRKMVLVSKSQGRDAARPLATRYLQRFPGGPSAAAARDLAP
jgi:ferric-dicitrate binding protein FerR (iron transport regulator)/TolA-binding protein